MKDGIWVPIQGIRIRARRRSFVIAAGHAYMDTSVKSINILSDLNTGVGKGHRRDMIVCESSPTPPPISQGRGSAVGLDVGRGRDSSTENQSRVA